MPVSQTDPQGVYSDQGIRTQYGIILPPGARVAAYVRSIGAQSGDDAFLVSNLVPTLAQGLARVRPNLGDYVVVLPGHTEFVSDATTFSNALIAGTKILGVGRGANTPTFTWTVATARWTVAVNDVVIAGLRLQTTGIGGTLSSNTTNAINVTGNDFGFYYNEVEGGTFSATAVIVLTIGGACNRADISNNIFRAETTAGPQTIAVSTTGNDCRICDNEISSGAPSATGHINVTNTAQRIKILRNVINNSLPGSVAAIAFSNVACTGQCSFNTCTVMSTGVQVSGTTGITVGGTNNAVGFFQNFVVNDVNKSGIIQPVADT